METNLSRNPSEQSKMTNAKAMIQYAEKNPYEFISYLQTDFPHLLEDIQSDQLTSKKKLLTTLFIYLKSLFIVEGSDLYGRAYVSDELFQDAKKTASVITVANLWNIATTVPILFIAFMDIAGGVLLALFFGWCLLAFSNHTGAMAAGNRPGKPTIGAMLGFVLINIGLTAISGAGTELSMNVSKLSERHAQKIVEQQILAPLAIEMKSSQQALQQANDLKQECTKKAEAFFKMPANSRNRDTLHLQLWGDHKDRNNLEIWDNKPLEHIPLCHRATRLETEGKNRLTIAQSAFNREQANSQRSGSLLHLKNNYPEIFQANFRDNSSISSGVEATRLAIEEFSYKLTRGDFAALGFSFFSFAISVITSGTALLLTIAHARRKDVQNSYDPYILLVRNQLFQAVRQGLSTPKN